MFDEAVMEVRAVGLVERTAVLQPLGEDERRVDDRDREHEQREEQGDGGRRFQEPLHRDASRAMKPSSSAPESPMKILAG